jgi:predicted dinucleotide-utilizing enzyme
VPELASTRNPKVWVYRFVDEAHGWRLSVATHAEPGSQQLSLGGFRIAPLERTRTPGFTTDREAIALAMGMEEKVHWSRVIHVGGPLALRDIKRIMGGKCVLAPTPESRIGQPQDAAMLDFAARCLNEVEQRAGIHVTTGQDLGHGLMHDGRTQSLDYLNARFKGSVVADTSIPTGEGNLRLLQGMLRAWSIPPERSTIGLVGCGNIGMHIVRRLREEHPGVTLLVCESRAERRAELEAMGIRTAAAEAKPEFLRLPMDALVVNASGGTLDRLSVMACAANERLRVVCGSENLVMPEPGLEELLRAAEKVFAPTELGGMMGYLTAVEEYLSVIEGVPFSVETMLAPAMRLETAGYETTARIIANGHSENFEDAVTAVYEGQV